MKTSMVKRKIKKVAIFGLLMMTMCILTFLCATTKVVHATNNEVTNGTTDETNGDTNQSELSVDGTNDGISFSFDSGDGTTSLSSTLQILLVLTVISLAPSFIIMVTSFTRIIIVLHFTRSALGTQTTPPNQIMIGLALFLTFFIMSPTIMAVNTNAIQPLNAGEITQEEAFERGMEPVRNFMFEQMDEQDKELKLFLNIAQITEVNSPDDIPTTVLIPAFILNELKAAFIMGFLIYIPFIIIDMVVASTLMSMGMMMLPPTTISMPFKILLFIMADGWNLIIGQLVRTFYS